MYTLQNSINWARTYLEYVPLTAGFGFEPAVSSGNLVRNSLLVPPITWPWNRATFQLSSPTTPGTQDYAVPLSSIPDFGFLEKVMLTDPSGHITEITDVFNVNAMALSAEQQRPEAACILLITSSTITVRLLGNPDLAYTVTLIYQKRPVMMGPFSVSAASFGGGQLTLTGTFDTLAFPTGATAQITGFANAGNNGAFTVVSCNATTLVVTDAAGVSEPNPPAPGAFAANFDWAPIPDWYQEVYNCLFLSEMFHQNDDPQSAQTYRQRGVAAFLSKAVGLTQTQKKAFVQQWIARDAEVASALQMAQLGTQAKGV
jgi:hypothetical protein